MRLALTALALIAAAPLVAQDAPQMPGVQDVSRVPAGTYAVDPGHTQATFTVDHMGFSDYTGQFGGMTGTITIDPAKPEAARVDVTIDMNGISTTVPGLTKHMKSADFFDVEKHPTAKFVSTNVKVDGTEATITGNLTIKGITRPVVLDAEFVGAGQNPMSKQVNFGFRATTTVKRSDFGITYGIPVVSDAVALKINAAFQPAE